MQQKRQYFFRFCDNTHFHMNISLSHKIWLLLICWTDPFPSLVLICILHFNRPAHSIQQIVFSFQLHTVKRHSNYETWTTLISTLNWNGCVSKCTLIYILFGFGSIIRNLCIEHNSLYATKYLNNLCSFTSNLWKKWNK